MEAQKKQLAPAFYASSEVNAGHIGRSAHGGRRGIGFWLDWAPMIVLGLAIAISGLSVIGKSVFSDRTATAPIVQAQPRVREAVGAGMPVRNSAVPVGGRTAS
jgi:hypothetical protein